MKFKLLEEQKEHEKPPSRYDEESYISSNKPNTVLTNDKLMNLASEVETPLKKARFLDFANLWIKDESVNRTGTHKDRMAFSLLKMYQWHYLKGNHLFHNGKPPSCSLISAGNAALAIGSLFRDYNLPKLNVLLDNSINQSIQDLLAKNHCRVFKTNIFSKALTPKEILELTDNVDGIDVTSYSLLDTGNKFYRNLVENTLKKSPKFIIVPYGSGVLFENFCSIIREKGVGKDISLIGVTVKNKLSKADKLFSAYSPFDFNMDRINCLKQFGYIGDVSTITSIDDQYLEEAMVTLKENNILAEYSSAVTIAYLIENARSFPKKSCYVVINTGKGQCNVND